MMRLSWWRMSNGRRRIGRSISRRDAAKLAMTLITAPIIAISLVLLSVFVPIAFIPGLSGLLFQQFARDGECGDADLGV